MLPLNPSSQLAYDLKLAQKVEVPLYNSAWATQIREPQTHHESRENKNQPVRNERKELRACEVPAEV